MSNSLLLLLNKTSTSLPPESDKMITEDGQIMLTEDGQIMITEG